MTVYVDDAVHPFGRMLMGHLWADSLEELLAFVDVIKVQRKWIQGHPTLSFGKHKNASWVHFDISKGKRDLALKYGASAVDRYECLCHLARLDIQSGDDYLVRRGQEKLALIERIRGKRSRLKNRYFRFSARYRR